MRKMWIWLLLFAFLCPPAASAAEVPPCIALAVTGKGEGNLPERIAAQGARATFFPESGSWEQGRRILDAGHEIGLTAPENWNFLSRRDVYRQLRARRMLLPPCQIRIVRPEGRVSDGVRQVAEVQGMHILGNALDPWAEAPAGRSLMERLKPGDILLLDGDDPELILNLIRVLQNQGYRLVTVSELHRLLGRGFDRG